MKAFINKFLKPFNAEIHGKGYLQALAKGEFQNDEYSYQKDFFTAKNIDLIFDIGANRGATVGKYKSLFPEATIHAFEPFPDTFEILKAEFGETIICNQMAVAEKTGELDFYFNQNPDTNSMYKSKQSGLSSDSSAKNVGQIKVKSITVDEYCINNKIDKINILKMDIQGGELSALKGCVRMLEEGKIDLIFCECFFIEQYEKQPLFYDVASFLKKFNFQLQDLYSPFYGNGKLAWCDAVFIPQI